MVYRLFSALFATIVLVAWIIVSKSSGLSPIRAIRAFVKMVRLDLLGYIIAFVTLCMPFIYLEFKVINSYGGWNYGGVVPYLPEFIDIINVSKGNWALGRVMKFLELDSRNIATGEVDTGFTLILLCLFLGFIVLTIRRKIMSPKHGDHGFLMVFEIIGIAVIVNILLPVRLSSNGISLWWFIYSLFPGATSIRAIGRVFLF